VRISPCRTQPVVVPNAAGQLVRGPSVNVIFWSYSNTPDVGDVSVIGYVVFPNVAIVTVLEPLSILRTTLSVTKPTAASAVLTPSLMVS